MFSTVASILVLGCVTFLLILAKPYLKERYRPWIVHYLADTMSAEEKKTIYAQISRQTPSLWDSAPEPLLGRLAKPGLSVSAYGVQVNINNAGMRANQPYLNKSPSHYRIVCLGDSFVFGEAGLVEDRWCDQLQAWFQQTGTRIAGKEVETIAAGLPSWTMLQEATYMTSRLSDYDPDLIIVLTVANDITEDSGVTGAGLLTNDFSNSERRWGSGTMVNSASVKFGSHDYSALYYDPAPLATSMWLQSMTALKRLSDLQQKRGGKILLSVLNETGEDLTYFENMYRYYFKYTGIDAKTFTVTYQKSPRTMLQHDSHPNRDGYALMTAEYLHAMEKAGLLDNPHSPPPALATQLIPQFNQPCDEALLTQQRNNWVGDLFEQMTFESMDVRKANTLLGGILPDDTNPHAGVWASIRAGFLLRTNKALTTMYPDIDIPERSELFPLEIKMTVHGKQTRIFNFSHAGRQTLALDISNYLHKLPALEIMLESNHYFTQIDDPRMKVFHLVSAGWR